MPGAAATIAIEPTTIVLGETKEIVVTGYGFDDCHGDFQITARIEDSWFGPDVLGHPLGSVPVSIGDPGRLDAVIPVEDSFPGDWTGAITLEGGCYVGTRSHLAGMEHRLVTGLLRLALRATTDDLADAGITAPAGADQAAGFVVPRDRIDWLRSLGGSPRPAERAFSSLEAWVGDSLCSVADLVAGAVTGRGDAIVWVGLPGQPEPCLAEGAVVTFRVGPSDVRLANEEVAVRGLVVAFLPAFPAPGSVGAFAAGSPAEASPGRPSVAGPAPQREPEALEPRGLDPAAASPWGAASLVGAVAAAAILLAVATRLRR